MSSEGWIKLHREIFDSDIWHDVTTFRLFIYLIGRASHQDGLKYKGMTLNKGQYIRSYRKLADDLSYKEGRGYKKYSLNTIKRCVQKLIDAKRVNVNETELGTLFTIVNYAKYQHLDDSRNESQNAISEEARTNGELIENEVRTNGEQEQELKNLRIKELYTTTTTTTQAGEFENEKNNAIIFYEKNIGIIRSSIAEEMIVWINDYGDEMVIEAMRRAINRNKANWGYAKSILQSWSRKGIRNLEQAKAEEVEFQSQQQARMTGRRYVQPSKKEIVPDWFNERNKQQAAPEQDVSEMEKILKKYKTGG